MRTSTSSPEEHSGTENHRILVEETDEGENLRERVHDLKQLVRAYQLGWIKETRSEDQVW